MKRQPALSLQGEWVHLLLPVIQIAANANANPPGKRGSSGRSSICRRGDHQNENRTTHPFHRQECPSRGIRAHRRIPRLRIHLGPRASRDARESQAAVSLPAVRSRRSTSRWPIRSIALSMAAAVTKNLKLATGICLVPEHEPLALAKQFATLDAYSGGRVLFGIGAGWLQRGDRFVRRRFSPSMDRDRRDGRRDAQAVDRGRAVVRGQVRKVSASEVAAEARAEVGTAGDDRQPRQERAQARREMGRRMVPDCAERRRS